MAPQRRWVLTGASGWFGRTALWEYEQVHGPEALRRDVIACASSSKDIDIGSPHGPVSAVSLETLDGIDGAEGMIHLAFLTRDRIAEVGVESYIAQNRAITALVADCISRHPGIPIITTSSGAAAVFDAAVADLTSNPYAALKHEEEELWRCSGAQRMAAVFRVYGAAGRFIKDPKVFALSDFLSRALAGERIEIHSRRPVIRSYVHVGTMMRLLWAMLESPTEPGLCHVDAVLQTMSLVDLAKEISKLWGLPEPLFHIDPSLPADDYRADSGPFRELLRQYRIAAPALREQLQETAHHMAAP
ncbi:NAD(P)-dependent oxidoreductase [Synechococcus sp. CBW1107]|uniref:NAD-dependent epimerase/dehydratase family protein n=1 Tax=Synechococcus sp. CBW1107 TaxID=2789857 RepID=UPI0018CE85F2|nr:NAD-dependent epimerase/dehydratase family protein [Synechococcus sp. CBW1107]QPN56325.1 NAD(P)-dependent oxidoreductase [Synechococcus sp. CBW1107]